jgi:hypothetical protein
MTDGDLPEGTGKKGGFQAAQGRAPLCIATRRQPRCWRIGSAVIPRQMKRE